MATLSTVNVKITGDTGQLVTSLTTAEKRVTAFSTKISTIGTAEARGLSNLGRGFLNAAGQSGVLNSEISILASSVGNVGLAAAGAGIGIGALVGGLGLSIKSAIGFEAAITRVAKTAGLSASETSKFGDAILDMSRRLPVATSDLTNIAVVAGQLGISGAQNISNFTEEVAKLASTTGVSSEVLATSLGTLAQVSGLPIKDISRLSSAITELGNTSNSTESQILDFSTRLVGVATALNIPLIAVTGISSAFAAAGADAEAGSTAIQRLFVGIAEAAQKGGDELTLFANVAGLSAAKFRDLATTHPEEAFTLFIEGLRGVPNAIEVLDALGLSDVRLVRSVLAVANSQEPLRKSIETANRAALENTATNIEFARSADTTAAKIQLLKNNLSAAAVEIGQVFLPAVNAALDGVNGLFDTSIDQRIENFKSRISGIADAFDTLGGSISDAAHEIAPLNDALERIPGTDAIDALTGAFGALGRAADLTGFSVRDALSAAVPAIGLLNILDAFTRDDSTTKTAKKAAGGLDLDALFPILGPPLPANFQTPSRPPIGIPPGLGSGGAGGAGSAAHAMTALEAAMDGVITRTEALTLGLTDQQAITLELAVAGNKAADEEYRRRIELETLARVFPGLTSEEVQFQLGLAAIQDHLKATGESIEQFILDTSTTALEGFKSAFDAIFNKPTRETAELQLQLDQLKRKKLLLPGASDSQQKSIDADIARIQKLIDIRNNELDILKDQQQIAIAGSFADKDQITQLGLLTAATANSRDEVDRNAGAVFLHTIATIGLKNQTLDLTTAFAHLGDTVANSAVPGSATSGLTLADALAALAGLPDHGASLLPSFATGIDSVPRDMTARIHRGERITPAGQFGEAGQPLNITSYITVEGDATERTVAMIKKAVREESENALRRASFRGSYVTSGAYTPS